MSDLLFAKADMSTTASAHVLIEVVRISMQKFGNDLPGRKVSE